MGARVVYLVVGLVDGYACTVRQLTFCKHFDILLIPRTNVGTWIAPLFRTRNEHTTRLLAFALRMNYAWGLEFVELTNGNEEEQARTRTRTRSTTRTSGHASGRGRAGKHGQEQQQEEEEWGYEPNVLGLHGNAVLSKCQLSAKDSSVVRSRLVNI